MSDTIERNIDITVLGHRIRSEGDLEALGGSDLVAIHNHCSDKPTQRFADKSSAVRRTWAAVEAYAREGGNFEATEEELAKQQARKEVQEAKKPPLELDEPPAPPKPAKAPKAKKEKVEGESRGRPRGFNFRFPLSNAGAKPPKETSKRFKVLQLLLRKEGATFEQVMEESGWKRTDAYEGIRLLHYANGYRLFTTEGKNGEVFIHASAEKQ